jgi:hypothetical protein
LPTPFAREGQSLPLPEKRENPLKSTGLAMVGKLVYTCP